VEVEDAEFSGVTVGQSSWGSRIRSSVRLD
jgi:hypothetical protein